MNFCYSCSKYEFTLRIGEVCCDLQLLADKEWDVFTSRIEKTTQLIFWANGSFGIDDS